MVNSFVNSRSLRKTRQGISISSQKECIEFGQKMSWATGITRRPLTINESELESTKKLKIFMLARRNPRLTWSDYPIKKSR